MVDEGEEEAGVSGDGRLGFCESNGRRRREGQAVWSLRVAGLWGG